MDEGLGEENGSGGVLRHALRIDTTEYQYITDKSRRLSRLACVHVVFVHKV